jgi:drug/metabolite transporter (DMT)-like permease
VCPSEKGIFDIQPILSMNKTRITILLAITAVYAVCFVMIKAGLPFAPPLRFAGLRALIAGVALLGLAIALRQPWRPPRRLWFRLLGLALAAPAGAFAGMFLSPGQAGAGIASVLGNIQPLFTVVLAAIFLEERLTPDKSTALVLGLIGVTLIVSPALVAADVGSFSGAMLALAASAGSAAGNVIFKTMGTQRNLLTIAAWQLIVGSLPLLALSTLIERDGKMIWTAEFLGLLLFLAIIGTSLTTVVWYWLVQREDLGRLTMALFLVPVLGLGIAALAFGEEISPFKGLGVAMTIIAAGVAIRKPKPDSGANQQR